MLVSSDWQETSLPWGLYGDWGLQTPHSREALPVAPAQEVWVCTDTVGTPPHFSIYTPNPDFLLKSLLKRLETKPRCDPLYTAVGTGSKLGEIWMGELWNRCIESKLLELWELRQKGPEFKATLGYHWDPVLNPDKAKQKGKVRPLQYFIIAVANQEVVFAYIFKGEKKKKKGRHSKEYIWLPMVRRQILDVHLDIFGIM